MHKSQESEVEVMDLLSELHLRLAAVVKTAAVGQDDGIP